MNRRRTIAAAAVLVAIGLAAVWPEDAPPGDAVVQVESPEAADARIRALQAFAAARSPGPSPAPAPVLGAEPVTPPINPPAPAPPGVMSAWATALAPLLAAADSRLDGGPRERSADGGTRRRAWNDLEDPPVLGSAEDAGKAEPACNPGPIRVGLNQTPVDIVIAIDTSGSMLRILPVVNKWLLEKLEPSVKRASIDYRLILVMDDQFLQEWSQRGPEPTWKPSDAGVLIRKPVESHDVLNVLLETATTFGSSWLTKLRPDSRVHVVLVTDDDPAQGQTATFISNLTQIAGGRLGTEAAPAFQLHGLLGFTGKAPWVVLPDTPLQTARCGVRPGREYQQLVQSTGGLRASLCTRESLDAFTDELLARSSPGLPCDAPLPPSFPVSRLTSIRAIAREGRPERQLDRAIDVHNCEFSTASYLVTGARLTICPASCRALGEEGYDAIEAVATCP